jgi:hypothetical protein
VKAQITDDGELVIKRGWMRDVAVLIGAAIFGGGGVAAVTGGAGIIKPLDAGARPRSDREIREIARDEVAAERRVVQNEFDHVNEKIDKVDDKIDVVDEKTQNKLDRILERLPSS